jgi:hypothetical protein
MNSRYTKLSFWIITTIVVWLVFGLIYWSAPKTFKVADIRDGIFLDKSKLVTSMVFNELFPVKNSKCEFRNDNIFCTGSYTKRICFDDGECSSSEFQLALTTNEIDEKKISSFIYFIEPKDNRLFSKERLEIHWPQLEQYILKNPGLYVNLPRRIYFSLVADNKVHDANKAVEFSKLIHSEKIVKVRESTILNMDLPKNFFEELEPILVPYSNKPNFNRALYFSGITLLSIGYGDIVPVSGLGRMLAILEGFIGLILMAIIAVVFYDKLRKRKI